MPEVQVITRTIMAFAFISMLCSCGEESQVSSHSSGSEDDAPPICITKVTTHSGGISLTGGGFLLAGQDSGQPVSCMAKQQVLDDIGAYKFFAGRFATACAVVGSTTAGVPGIPVVMGFISLWKRAHDQYVNEIEFYVKDLKCENGITPELHLNARNAICLPNTWLGIECVHPITGTWLQKPEVVGSSPQGNIPPEYHYAFGTDGLLKSHGHGTAGKSYQSLQDGMQHWVNYDEDSTGSFTSVSGDDLSNGHLSVALGASTLTRLNQPIAPKYPYADPEPNPAWGGSFDYSINLVDYPNKMIWTLPGVGSTTLIREQ